MTPRLLVCWFNRTPFGFKLAVVGLAVAGPWLLVSGDALATLHTRVQELPTASAAALRC